MLKLPQVRLRTNAGTIGNWHSCVTGSESVLQSIGSITDFFDIDTTEGKRPVFRIGGIAVFNRVPIRRVYSEPWI
jgi:hypothetical protein